MWYTQRLGQKANTSGRYHSTRWATESALSQLVLSNREPHACAAVIFFERVTSILAQILTQHLAKYWQKWVELPPAAIETITKGGYYTVKIEEGFRLIAFNSDYGSVSTAIV